MIRSYIRLEHQTHDRDSLSLALVSIQASCSQPQQRETPKTLSLSAANPLPSLAYQSAYEEKVNNMCKVNSKATYARHSSICNLFLWFICPGISLSDLLCSIHFYLLWKTGEHNCWNGSINSWQSYRGEIINSSTCSNDISSWRDATSSNLSCKSFSFSTIRPSLPSSSRDFSSTRDSSPPFCQSICH